jgi:hypothetical protein
VQVVESFVTSLGTCVYVFFPEEVFYRHKHKYIVVFGHAYIDKEKIEIREFNN